MVNSQFCPKISVICNAILDKENKNLKIEIMHLKGQSKTKIKTFREGNRKIESWVEIICRIRTCSCLKEQLAKKKTHLSNVLSHSLVNVLVALPAKNSTCNMQHGEINYFFNIGQFIYWKKTVLWTRKILLDWHVHQLFPSCFQSYFRSFKWSMAFHCSKLARIGRKNVYYLSWRKFSSSWTFDTHTSLISISFSILRKICQSFYQLHLSVYLF